jgi:pimeloyl-ACP methyl ester carboxylesterase
MLAEKISIIICPGIHEPDLTENFISGGLETYFQSQENSVNILSVPNDGFSALSGFNILQVLRHRLGDRTKSPVIFISFSAGVVGAIAAAHLWQTLGGNIKAFIAIDGWGVPLLGSFPIHRMSHDYFTHWSSKILGSGQDSFYADPPVEHLSMWLMPQTIQGRWVDSSNEVSPPKSPLTAAEFLQMLLNRYQ